MKNISQDIWSPGQDFNMGPPEYEVGLLTTQLQCPPVDGYVKPQWANGGEYLIHCQMQVTSV
jgi:hypothetical protein